MKIIFVIGFIMGGIVGYAMHAILEMADDQESESEDEK